MIILKKGGIQTTGNIMLLTLPNNLMANVTEVCKLLWTDCAFQSLAESSTGNWGTVPCLQCPLDHSTVGDSIRQAHSRVLLHLVPHFFLSRHPSILAGDALGDDFEGGSESEEDEGEDDEGEADEDEDEEPRSRSGKKKSAPGMSDLDQRRQDRASGNDPLQVGHRLSVCDSGLAVNLFFS